MNLSDFQPTYTHAINQRLTFTRVGKFFAGRFFLDFDVFLPSKGLNLQRPLVWTLEQKRAFILSLLKHQSIQEITVVQNEEKTEQYGGYHWEVIDGKQRLNTAFEFLNDKFTIVHGDTEYLFSELPEDCQKQIDRWNPLVTVHYSYPPDPISDETKIQIFEQINFLGTSQDIEHLNSLKA